MSQHAITQHATSVASWIRCSRVALVIGLASAAVLAVAAWTSPTTEVPRILPGYLTAFLYFLGLSLGSAVLLMIHALTGGRWGMFIGRALSAALVPLPLLALAFLPIFFGIEQLFPWAVPGAAEHHPLIESKSRYLNIEGFELRAGIYFVFWLILCFWLRLGTRPAEPEVVAGRRSWLAGLSGPGLIGYGLTMTFATVDWNMSLLPDWYSSMLPVMAWGGQVLSAMAMATLVTLLVRGNAPWAAVASPERFSDLAGLLFTFTMFWAYTSFMQFLITWCGNLPHEIIYYFPRTSGSWFYVFMIVVVFGWAIPYFSLLFRPIKTNPRRLTAIVSILVVTRLIDLYWWIMPSISPEGVRLGWQELLSLLAIGGIWIAAFTSRFAQVLTGPIEEFGMTNWTAAQAAQHAQH
jgi:hypothetical protein